MLTILLMLVLVQRLLLVMLMLMMKGLMLVMLVMLMMIMLMLMMLMLKRLVLASLWSAWQLLFHQKFHVGKGGGGFEVAAAENYDRQRKIIIVKGKLWTLSNIQPQKVQHWQLSAMDLLELLTLVVKICHEDWSTYNMDQGNLNIKIVTK